MKAFCLAILLLGSGLKCLCQSPLMNFEEIQTDKNIKRVHTRIFKSEDTLQTQGRDFYILEFDELGKLILKYRYTFWDVVSYDHTTSYEYDSIGNLLKEVKLQKKLNLGKRDSSYISKFGDEPNNSMTVYSYNSKNQLVKEESYSFGRNMEQERLRLRSEISYFYNKKGLIKKEVSSTPSGKISFQNYTTIYKYDEKDRRIHEERTLISGSSEVSTYTYDGQDQLIEEQIINQSNVFQNKHFKYEYNAIGQQTRTLVFDPASGKFILHKEILYNEKGQRIFKRGDTLFDYYDNGLVKQQLWKSDRTNEVVNFITTYDFY